MKQREYHIKIHSIGRFVFALTAVFCLTTILLVDFIRLIENKFITIMLFIAVFAISHYIAYLVGMAKAKVIFTDEAFIHVWERKFILSRETDIKIPWNLVDNYVFQKDRTFDSFIINLTTKVRYKINRINTIPIRDDFEKLVKNFQQLSNEYRKGTVADNDTTLIKEGESIYASKSFKWAFYLMAFVFLILLLNIIFNPDYGTWSSFGVIGGALIFYGVRVIRQNKNNN
jgi:cell division protein FtsW (lipid II flippase)